MAKEIACRSTTAAGIVSLLHDEPLQLHEYAIRKLNEIVDDFWFEIADSISLIEFYSQKERFRERRTAALIASKLNYHLGCYDIALTYALGAGELLFVTNNRQYLHTMIYKCIECYKKARQSGKMVDSRLETIVNKVFDKCLQQERYHNTIGLALETNRMDVLQKVVLNSENPLSVIKHVFRLTVNHFQNHSFQNTVFHCLVGIYNILRLPDHFTLCKCLLHLEDHETIAKMLGNLLNGKEDDMSMAYQIGFDLYENANQKLLWKIINKLRTFDVEDIQNIRVFKFRLKELFSILRGDVTTELYLHFLVRHNHTDKYILENMKIFSRDQICHSAVVFANSLMNYGTASDKFIIDNIDWWCQESHWAEFSATAGLGMINKGYEQDAVKLMESYFPASVGSEGKYTEGGFCYALGLMHANHGARIIDHLILRLKSAKELEVIHGCCLGIGLAALGTNRQDIYKLLRDVLYRDEATIGESIGIAIGLNGMGSKSASAVKEMTDYARSTKHDKIIRGLGIGIALMMYGCLDECETVVTNLSNDKEPQLRCAAMHTLAMAHSASSDAKVAQRLLAVAASDPSDDVRRAAIQALGFVFLDDLKNCISAISLLIDSYKSHTRYGAALALGISCAGTGNEEALSLLWDLTDDMENHVVQGALIASGLILIQQTPFTCPRLEWFQELYHEITEDRNEHEIVKFGSILAEGIVNGGGRNVTISLKSRGGRVRMDAVAGMLVFTQYWYWFPLVHFLSLTFLPTCLIGVNERLLMPRMGFISNIKPSYFGYPPAVKRIKTSQETGLITFILSFAAKMRRASSQPSTISSESEESQTTAKTDDTEETVVPEQDFEIVLNPGRVAVDQMKFVKIHERSRYEAVKDISEGGIVMMRDKQRGTPEALVEPVNVDIEEYSNGECYASDTSSDITYV